MSRPHTRWFRVAEAPRHWLVFAYGGYRWEVRSDDGSSIVVDSDGLAEALGKEPGSPRNDEQHCRSTATKLFDAGNRESWVQYPYGGVATTAEIEAGWAPGDGAA